MRRISCRLFLLAISALLILSACSSGTPETALGWNASTPSGLRFYERLVPYAAIHYAPPTLPDQAEAVAKAAEKLVAKHRSWGRLVEAERLDIWIVPAGRTWPQGLATPPAGRKARAVAPRTVLMFEQDTEGLDEQGLDMAIAVALTQQESSPAFQVEWLHEGMGAAMATGWNLSPLYRRWDLYYETMAKLLEDPSAAGTPQWREAAWCLAGLLMDRWGVNFTAYGYRKASELTPSAALLWAAGTDDLAKAAVYWRGRYTQMAVGERNQMKIGDLNWRYSAADLSPMRLEPKLSTLPKGPGPNDSYSPHSYDLNVRYDPTRRTVGGDAVLTWQNGEGIFVDTLYFNLWPNAEQFAIFGGGVSIAKVTVDGKEAPFTARYLDLAVPLGRSVGPGEKVTVAIRFTTRLPGVTTLRNLGQESLTRFHLTQWHPVLAVLDDRGWILHGMNTRIAEPYAEIAAYKVKLDVPAGTVVGGSGHRTDRKEQGDRWIYEYEAPNVREWVATGGKNLIEQTRMIDGVAVHLIHTSEAWIKEVGDHIERGMSFYNQKFGRYPHRDLVVSCCEGMEWPGLMFTGELPPPNNEQARQRFLYVTYHELAHEWFYGAVGNDQYHEPWIDEGFTTYADRTAFRAFGWPPYGGDLRRDISGPVRVTASQNEIIRAGSMSSIYFKGALVLEDLEQLLGPSVMDGLMKEWVRRMTFKTATAADFVRFAQEYSGRDLSQFFREHNVFPEDRQAYQPFLPYGRALPE